MKEYYFITYAWRRSGEVMWHYENEMIDGNPIDWIFERKNDPEHYRIIFYDKIAKISYDNYKDKLD